MTDKAGFLKLGNLRKAKDCLQGVVDQQALDDIESDLELNAQKLYSLALVHYRFAIRQSSPHWRQKISRLYYAAYNASKSLRLYAKGEYSTESKDHSKIGDLPDDFPQRAKFGNKLQVLRTDRNQADYDHLATAKDLTNTVAEHEKLVFEFVSSVRAYLIGRGISLVGKL